MDAENIRAKVKKVFFDLFQKDESKIQDSYCTDNFFGSKMGLLPGDVVACMLLRKNLICRFRPHIYKRGNLIH